MNSVSHGVRVLAKRPGFTAAAVLVLALGIGSNAAIFSLVNAFLLKPLAIHNPEELVGLYSRDTRKPDSYRATSYPNFVDLRGQSGVFTSLAAHNLAMVGLTEGDTTRRVSRDPRARCRKRQVLLVPHAHSGLHVLGRRPEHGELAAAVVDKVKR